MLFSAKFLFLLPATIPLSFCTSTSIDLIDLILRVLLLHLQSLAKSNPAAHPALFVTSIPMISQPSASVSRTSMAKAAKANPTELLAEGNGDVVHVALGGPVSPEEVLDTENTAGKFLNLYSQEKGKYEFEVGCGW